VQRRQRRPVPKGTTSASDGVTRIEHTAHTVGCERYIGFRFYINGRVTR
jgi:hypothetical protein